MLDRSTRLGPALGLMLLFANCGETRIRPQTLEQKDGWSYWSVPQQRGRAKDFRLSYSGREVSGPWILLTPLGEFQLLAAEDQHSASGWHKVGELSSVAVPHSSQAIAPSDLENGFYRSDDRRKLADTPDSWIHIRTGERGSWAKPELLFDPGFVQSSLGSPAPEAPTPPQ